jgi:YfiH family protein
MLCYADCVPLLFYDQRRNAVGISHAGWQGTFLGIGGLTVAAMQRHFGTDPAECLAAIGPSIGPDDYEVDEPVITRIISKWQAFEQFATSTRPGRWQLDLWKWNTMQLMAAGIPGENILQAGFSTRSHSDILFSHRASGGKTGRFGALVCL